MPLEHLLSTSSAGVLVSVELAVAGAAYLFAVRRLPRWPVHRTVCFLAGLGVLLLALGSGLDVYAEKLLSVHMVQHMLMTMVAPPLLLLGAPLTLLLRSVRSVRRPLSRLLHSRAARYLTRPPVAWALFAAATVATHLTPFYGAALESASLHALEHAMYLATGLLFWIPVVDADPIPRARTAPVGRLMYLLTAMAPMALVGVTLLSWDAVRYASYQVPAAELGVSAIEDQQLAGTIMWVGGKLVMLAALLCLGWTALRREERRQVAREAYEDRARPVAAVPIEGERR
jgi:putative membrane protein